MIVRERRWLTVILTVSLTLRLGWAVAQPRTAAVVDRLPDQREYLTLASHLVHGDGLRLYDARFDQDVLAYRLPGYPLVVAACHGSVLAVRLLQALIDTGTVAGVYLLARRLSGAPTAIAAAAWVALNPLLVYFSGLLLTETLFTATLVWGTYAIAGQSTLAAAASFMVAVYLRPTALVLGPALSLANSGVRPAYRCRSAAVILLAMAIGLVPWAARNWVRLGTPVFTTTNDGVTLADGFHDGATGGSDQRFVNGLPALGSMTEVGRSRALGRDARRWAAEHVGRLPALTAAKVVRGWSPVPLSAEFGRPLYRLIGGGYGVPFDLCWLLGLCAGRVRGRLVRGRLVRGRLLLVMPAVVVTAVQAATVGSIRYRVPAEPMLAVLAGAGTVAALGWARRSRSAGPPLDRG